MSDLHEGTTLLRRYTIKAGCWDEFLAVWADIVEVRKRYGFTVLFALADRKQNMFTWGISHPGDLEAVAKAYYADPERVALEIVGNYVDDHEVTEVTPVAIP